MYPPQFALFLGFYFYLLNVNAANDAQRVIPLSSLIQIRALQGATSFVVQRCSAEFAVSRTTALAYSGLVLHLGSSFDQNGCPKKPGKLFRNSGFMITRDRETDTKVETKKRNVVNRKKFKVQ